MFKYRFVVDQATGERYYIARAMLTNDEGPDIAADGANFYELDLEPYGAEASPILGVDLSVCGDELCITEGLDAAHKYGTPHYNDALRTMVTPCRMTPATVDGETIIVPKAVLQLVAKSEAEIDLNRWIPDARDEDGIYRQLHENVLSTVECCGNGSEEAADAVALYAKVMQTGIVACKADIQRCFLELYHAVRGELERYYAPYTELIGLIKLTCGLETRDGSVSNDR